MNRTRQSRSSFALLGAIVLGAAAALLSSANTGQPCEPQWDNALGQPGVGWPGLLNAEWVEDMTAYKGDLVAGGNFIQADGEPFFRIARWNAAAEVWQPFVMDGVVGMNGHVWNLAVYDGSLIAGGNFTVAGVETVNHIARWDDDSSAWHALDGGVAGGLPGQSFSVGTPSVTILVEYDETLIAGGNFISAGGVAANFIACWDGATESWQPLGSGMNAPVTALTVHNGDLIAGGNFTTAGSVAANRIARWNGAAWHPIGGGMNAWVLDLTVLDGELIAGGLFTTADGTLVNHIARWDTTSGVGSWRPLGFGMNSGVWDVFTHDGTLYAGGTFSMADGAPVNHIARWYPAPGVAGPWHAMDSGTNWNVYAMTSYEGNLVAGGRFTEAGKHPANRVAAWLACPVPPCCSGDLTGNGNVGVPDLLELLAAWGPCDDPQNCPADLTGNGSVGVPDLLELLSQWGPCP